MKLLRKRDFPDEKFSNAFLGFGPEESHFVVELTYNYVHGMQVCCVHRLLLGLMMYTKALRLSSWLPKSWEERSLDSLDLIFCVPGNHMVLFALIWCSSLV